MAIIVARHVESVTGSGAASTVVTRQGVVESHRIRRREWSRIVAIDTAYQRVMGPPQGVMEPCEIRYRKWNRIMVVIVIRQGVRIC